LDRGQRLGPANRQRLGDVAEEFLMFGQDVEIDVGLSVQQSGWGNDQAVRLQIAQPLLMSAKFGISCHAASLRYVALPLEEINGPLVAQLADNVLVRERPLEILGLVPRKRLLPSDPDYPLGHGGVVRVVFQIGLGELEIE